jgi:glycyl-tRNA synthetase (class II)
VTRSPAEMFVWQNASETSIEVIHLESNEIRHVTVLKFSETLRKLASCVVKCKEGCKSIYRIQHLVNVMQRQY